MKQETKNHPAQGLEQLSGFINHSSTDHAARCAALDANSKGNKMTEEIKYFPPEMTLRDWFAGHALASCMAIYGSPKPAICAEDAYIYADAMMKQREIKNDRI